MTSIWNGADDIPSLFILGLSGASLWLTWAFRSGGLRMALPTWSMAYPTLSIRQAQSL